MGPGLQKEMAKLFRKTTGARSESTFPLAAVVAEDCRSPRNATSLLASRWMSSIQGLIQLLTLKCRLSKNRRPYIYIKAFIYIKASEIFLPTNSMTSIFSGIILGNHYLGNGSTVERLASQQALIVCWRVSELSTFAWTICAVYD